MSGDLFKVQFLRSKTSFLFISEKWVRKFKDMKKLEDDSTIQIIYNSDKVAYFGWQQRNMLEDNVVGINATVATNLKMKEGDLISLVICSNVPLLQKVEMSPLSSDDLEIIESSSGLLQSTLLNQVRVVWHGQFLTAWISSSFRLSSKLVGSQSDVKIYLPLLHISEYFLNFGNCFMCKKSVDFCHLLSGQMDPNVTVGLLKQLTEVTIGDPVNSDSQTLQNSESTGTSVRNGISASSNSLSSSDVKAVCQDYNKSHDQFPKSMKAHYIFRVHPLNSDLHGYGPLDAFVSRPLFNKLFQIHGQSLFCKVKKLIGSKDSANPVLNSLGTENLKSSTRMAGEKCMYIQLLEVDSEREENCFGSNRQCVFMSNTLRSCLNLEIGSRVVVSELNTRLPGTKLERIDLYAYLDLKSVDLGKSFIHYVEQMTNGLLLCTNMFMTIPTEKGHCDVKVCLVPTTRTHTLLLPGKLNEDQIRVRRGEKDVFQLCPPAIKQSTVKNSSEQFYLSHLESTIDEGLTSLKLSLGLSGSIKSCDMVNNLLLLAKSSCGKSTTANVLCSLMQGPPYFVHNTVIQCRPLKGKTVESLLKHLQQFLDDCVYHQPSILVIDDLESIAGVPDDQDQNSQASVYFNRVARMLLHVLGSLQSSHSVAIIATAPSVSSISPSLVPPRGVHLFNTKLELPELSKTDRQGIFEKLFRKKLSSKEVRDVKCLENVEEYANKTEGYCCQDLSDIVDKATLAACMREVMSSKKPVIESCDVFQALSDSTPMLLRNLCLHKDSAFGWDDIGGLVYVKNELKEVFEWPALFPELFQNSPLRQQSGVLLYGAPGTGKTMLAAAVAKECGLNFISVKGPELLSKYIGASEEAVRNVFLKAQGAKPCVLFFDEFDSLAPRRGHDNTGVTDRVVNQLLTQLDGVESLVGVWVLAATSRPDLLDPALLRPGRLDRSVLCPLPDEIERIAILKALSRKMNLDVNVNFAQVAVDTVGFTGADLQAILYTAQLNAMEEWQSELGDEAHGEQVSLKVMQPHIDTAARHTRPSLTVQEQNRYHNIFRKFGAGRKEKNLLETPVQRATLA